MADGPALNEIVSDWRDVLRDWEKTLDTLDEVPTDDMDMNSALSLWTGVDDMIAVLSVLRQKFGVRAGEVMPWKGVVETEDGQYHRSAARQNEQWNGRGVLTALSKTYVDSNSGELVAAVPADVLVDVLPAMGEGQTSSKWKQSGLKLHGIDVENYRSVKWGTAKPARGPGR